MTKSVGVSGLVPTDWSDLAGFGLLGDYIGGVVGTILSFLALLALFATLVSTVKLNYWTTSLSLFSELLKTHERNAERVDSSRILQEFSFAYSQAMRIGGSDWSVEDRVDLAYTYVFYGASSGPKETLGKIYGEDRVHLLHNELSKKKNSEPVVGERFFHGHQQSLSHYMRNLFNSYMFIHQLKVRDEKKYELGRLIRTKLSNYDQAVLALNIISRLGREWEKADLVETYRPICNVPADFYGYDPALTLKKQFPTMSFEWEKAVVPRPRYWSATFGRLTLVAGLR